MNSLHHNLPQKAYLMAYRLLLPRRYGRYLDKAAGDKDKCHEALLHGTFYEEYDAFGFAHKDEGQRRTYLTDAVRDKIARRINSRKGNRLINNKYLTWQALQPFYRRRVELLTPATLADILAWGEAEGQLVLKPVDQCGGRGIRLLDTGSPASGWRQELNDCLSQRQRYIVEQRIVPHPFMARYHPSSINTVRYNTIRHGDGVQCFGAFFITGRAGHFVNNGAQGGVVAQIDPATGRILTDGCDKRGRRYAAHPDSGVPFKDEQFPQWEQLVRLTADMARCVKGCTYVAWDMTLTPDGWEPVEANLGEFTAQQTCLGRGLRHDFEKAVYGG